MRRATYRIAALTFALALALVLSQPWTVAQERIDRWMTAELSQELGLKVERVGGGALALLPIPRIIAKDVRLSTPDGALVATIPRVRADLGLAALIGGDVTFSEVTLFSPELNLQIGDGPFDPLWLMASTQLAAHGATPRLKVRENGTVLLRRGGSVVSIVRELGLDVQERAKGEAIQAVGAARWRGEAVSFTLASDSPARTVLPMIRVRSEPANFDFMASRRLSGERRGLEGTLQFATPSASRLSFWLGAGSPILLPLGETTLSGSLNLTSDVAELRNASLAIGSETLEGALDLRNREGRWRLSGTLHGRAFSIARSNAALAATLGIFDMTPGQVVDIDDLLAYDVDLRMSLQRVRLPGLTLTDVAAQLLATESRFDLAVASSSIHRGSARGRASLQRSDKGVEVRAQLSADRVDLGALSLEAFEARRMTGTGTLQAHIESSGRLLGDLLAQASGSLAFSARQGDFLGANLADAMRRLDRQPLAVLRDWRGGRTQFDEVAVSGTIERGHLQLQEGRASGAAYRLSLSGLVSLPDRAYRLAGMVQSPTTQGSLPFDITGPILEPAVQVNARSILERSGAAAPLFGARQPQ